MVEVVPVVALTPNSVRKDVLDPVTDVLLVVVVTVPVRVFSSNPFAALPLVMSTVTSLVRVMSSSSSLLRHDPGLIVAVDVVAYSQISPST